MDSSHRSERPVALVVAVDGVPRNSDLAGQLERAGFEPVIVATTDRRDEVVGPDSAGLNAALFVGVHGRLPTGGELGCALGHLAAYRTAFDVAQPWTVIVEDDADLSGSLAGLTSTLAALPLDRPAILSLYSWKGMVLREGSIRPVEGVPGSWFGCFFRPPNGAVGYVINRAALRVAVKRPDVHGRADWPPWAWAFDFYGVYPGPITHGDYESFLEAGRRAASGAQPPSLFGLALDVVTPRAARAFARDLPGWGRYATRVLRPSVRQLSGRRRQQPLDDSPDAPFVR